ncbi:MAG TPA: SDR family NAD(P)-dependent oxidoreductase [Acetobacteraceae bacterium]|nr:SDR family NAD(P)-dependent oxidoreductase [Acetobacteraceae bacterium]
MTSKAKTILLVGASRGLGLGLTEEYLSRGWQVVATARHPDRAEGLKSLAAAHPNFLRVEKLDTSDADAAKRLAASLRKNSLDVLFVVAGQASSGYAPIHETAPDAAAREFLVNSCAPPVVAEALLPCLVAGGPIVFMTSILGSLANSEGGMDLYNASKAALNMLAIGFAKRHADRRVLLMHPGWVRTDMGGAQAPLDINTSVRGMANVIASQGAGTGIAYVDYKGDPIPW